MGLTKREKHRRTISPLIENLTTFVGGEGGIEAMSLSQQLTDAILDAIEDIAGKKKQTGLTPGSAAWDSYSTAYTARYGVQPVRNAKANKMMANLATRIPAQDAPAVAAFYVQHPLAFYNQRMHPIELLLRDAESLYSQWKMGKPVIHSRSDQGNANLRELWRRNEQT